MKIYKGYSSWYGSADYGERGEFPDVEVMSSTELGVVKELIKELESIVGDVQSDLDQLKSYEQGDNTTGEFLRSAIR